jgi:hypothetical protein
MLRHEDAILVSKYKQQIEDTIFELMNRSPLNVKRGKTRDEDAVFNSKQLVAFAEKYLEAPLPSDIKKEIRVQAKNGLPPHAAANLLMSEIYSGMLHDMDTNHDGTITRGEFDRYIHTNFVPMPSISASPKTKSEGVPRK